MELFQLFVFGAFFAMLLMLSYNLAINNPKPKKEYHKITIMAMLWWAVVVAWWSILQILDLNDNFYQLVVSRQFAAMELPMIALIPFSIVHQNRSIKTTLLFNELPFFLFFILYLFTGSEVVRLTAFCYQMLYLVFIIIVGIRESRRYEQRLNNTYANIERRSLKWTSYLIICFVTLYILYVARVIFNAPYITPLFSILAIMSWCLVEHCILKQQAVDEEIIDAIERDEIQDSSSSEAKVDRVQERNEQIAQELDKLMKEGQWFLKEDATIKALAAEIGSNTKYLSTYLNEVEGKNFNAYINDLRLDYAEELLKDNGLTLSDIAFKSGFNSLNNFHRLFKLRHNCSPRQYRG